MLTKPKTGVQSKVTCLMFVLMKSCILKVRCTQDKNKPSGNFFNNIFYFNEILLKHYIPFPNTPYSLEIVLIFTEKIYFLQRKCL